MTAKTSGDSSRRVSRIIFRRIQDSFTTQGLQPKRPENAAPTCFLTRFPHANRSPPRNRCRAGIRPEALLQPSLAREPAAAALKLSSTRRVVMGFPRSDPMPYALFSDDAKLSKAYPTEADVWKHARKKAGSWSTSCPRTINRRRGRCWTMITRSGPAGPTPRKTRPRTRPAPRAKSSRNSSSVREGQRRSP
jgi:hypothetical protein